MLARDHQDNPAVVERYVDYFEQAGAVHGRVLSRNSLELASQWLHHAYTSVTIANGDGDGDVAAGLVATISIDCKSLPDEALPLIGPVVFQLVDTSVGPSIADDDMVDGIESRPCRRRLTEILVPPRSTCRPVAVWESCGHAFISVETTLDIPRPESEQATPPAYTPGTLQLKFEDGSRKRRRAAR